MCWHTPSSSTCSGPPTPCVSWCPRWAVVVVDRKDSCQCHYCHWSDPSLMHKVELSVLRRMTMRQRQRWRRSARRQVLGTYRRPGRQLRNFTLKKTQRCTVTCKQTVTVQKCLSMLNTKRKVLCEMCTGQNEYLIPFMQCLNHRFNNNILYIIF